MTLPLASAPGEAAPTPRPSRRSKWRAATLTLIYVVMIAHFVHWRIAGRTLTPIEPSESMQTLEQGLLNAGFVFFALALLSTLVLGRWVCGWGCHLVALQDLCTWLLKRIGLRPKPFRSRVLVFVPLLAALYMFVWPTVRRLWLREPGPTWMAHFFTQDYWATFPGVWMVLLTFAVCGFLVIYLLGNKGYCTYACPYGGFFGVLDRVAPGRIRATDACTQCGHCTAACTSNVRVHEEVHRFGMVVDPGCMKCTDCVSVCPNNALHFGFGRPSLAKGRAAAPPPRRAADYAWPEEIALAAVFLAALYAFRGLYDAVPFLLALGCGVISAFLLIEAARLAYRRSLSLHRVQLKLHGRITRGGAAFVAAGLLLGAFLLHSIWWQYHRHEADRLLSIASARQSRSPGDERAVADLTRAARGHLATIRAWGLLPSAKVEAQLGAASLYLGDLDAAEAHLSRALALEPRYGAARYKWAELLAHRGRLAEAFDHLKDAVRDDPSLGDARRDLLHAGQRLGRTPEVVATLDAAATWRDHDPGVALDLATAMAANHDLPGAVDLAQRTRATFDRHVDAHYRLALLLLEAGRAAEAVAPIEDARRLQPFNPAILRVWASTLHAADRLNEFLSRAPRPDDFATRYARAFALQQTGDEAGAAAELDSLRAAGYTTGLP